MEKNCGNTPHCSETVDRSPSYFESSPSLLQIEEDFLLSQPTSSQQNSKTLLKKDLIDLQNNFFEDEETSSSAVLDAFEISSSNSLLTNDTGSVEVVEENSSTDTSTDKIELDLDLQTKCIDESRDFIAKNDTNDDQTEVNQHSQHNVCQNTVLNSVITKLCSKEITLESPVIEQHKENEYMLVENEGYEKSQQNSNKLNKDFVSKEDCTGSRYASGKTKNVCKSKLNILTIDRNESLASLYSDNSQLNCIERTGESQNDMSLSLKKMSLGSSTVSDINPENRSSFLESKNIVSQNYNKSNDLDERKEYENLKQSTDENTVNTSLSTNNVVNLGSVNSCILHYKNQVDAIDNVPSSSNNKNRTISSKIKDLLSTPKSIRHSNQTKPVTAKLNPYHNINYDSFKDDITLDFNGKKLSEKSSKLQSIHSTVKAELCCSSSYNDSIGSIDMQSSKTSIESKHENQIEQGKYISVLQEGCSRTTALQPQPLVEENGVLSYDNSKETKPSTSSRCHNSITSRLMRQVHNTSSQTSDRNMAHFSIINVNLTGTTQNNNNLNVFKSGDYMTDNSENRNTLDVEQKTDMLKISKLGKLSNVSSSTIAKNIEFKENTWVDCDETNSSDLEEVCTCQYNLASKSHSESITSLNEIDELNCDKSKEIGHPLEVSSEMRSECHGNPPILFGLHQRKRKFNETHSIESECFEKRFNTFNNDIKSRKRVAYDCVTSHCSLQTDGPLPSQLTISCITAGRRTPRSVIPTRDNPPPELQNWLVQFQHWSNAERLLAVDCLIDHCNPTQVRHMMKIIEPQFQRDFISLLPRELALSVLSYLAPKDLLRAAQTCRSWRFLCDDNLLWKEKCRKAQIMTEPRFDRPTRGRAGTMPSITSPWKAAYMRQHIIEMNWRSRPIREPKVLKGHDDHVITCLQFSGNRIVSGSDDNTLKVWSAVTGRCLRTLIGHTGGVWSSQMSGNIIISGSTDRTLKVWDMETGQCIHTLLGHTSTVRCMHLHGNKVVSGSRDATLRVWDIQQGNCLHVLIGHLAAVRCVQYDGKLIVSGAYDYMVKIWHPERQECLHTLQGHTNRVYSLQFDGSHVVSGSLDTSIRVWDVETGSCKHTLMGHQSLTSGMELRQNILVSGNADSTVKVWDITTGQCLQTLSGPHKHQSAVTCLQFNSRFVVTSSDDGTVKLWDVKTGEFIRNLVSLDSGGSGGVVWRIRANDTKLICAVGSRNGTEETKLMVLDFDVEGACVKCS